MRNCEDRQVVLRGDVEGDAALVVPVAEADPRMDDLEQRGEVRAPAGDEDKFSSGPQATPMPLPTPQAQPTPLIDQFKNWIKK